MKKQTTNTTKTEIKKNPVLFKDFRWINIFSILMIILMGGMVIGVTGIIDDINNNR